MASTPAPKGRKMEDSNVCIACADSFTAKEAKKELLRPCRLCKTYYCRSCIRMMFLAAITDNTRMPPRCCTLIQIHVALPMLSMEEAVTYRAKFEEWLTVRKVYCPAPTCSAFIPELNLPGKREVEASTSLHDSLKRVLERVGKSPNARFFRNPAAFSPSYPQMTLTRIANNVSQYDQVELFLNDIDVIAVEALTTYGSDHSIAKAAAALKLEFEEDGDIRSLTRDLTLGTGDTQSFTCPTCDIHICANCHRVHHEGPCDSSNEDYELAMLETFGYKRCPKCNAGVKKMYGCPHMQCICGAHWCWYCLDPIEGCSCNGGEGADESDEEEDYDEYDEKARDAPEANVANHGLSHTPNNLPVNLDAGGGHRWANGDYDFGEEPEDSGRYQVWSCSHHFTEFEPKDDEHRRGDAKMMECNRCFATVGSRHKVIDEHAKKTRHEWWSRNKVEDDKTTVAKSIAWECSKCCLIACDMCKSRYAKNSS